MSCLINTGSCDSFSHGLCSERKLIPRLTHAALSDGEAKHLRDAASTWFFDFIFKEAFMHTLLVVIVIKGLFSKQIISSLYMIDVLDQKLAGLDLPDFLVCFDILALTTPHGKGTHHRITREQEE